MAEFCKQCADKMGFEPDFVGIAAPDHMIAVICEGCGLTWVDHTGTCIGDCLERHFNPQVTEEPTCPTPKTPDIR